MEHGRARTEGEGRSRRTVGGAQQKPGHASCRTRLVCMHSENERNADVIGIFHETPNDIPAQMNPTPWPRDRCGASHSSIVVFVAALYIIHRFPALAFCAATHRCSRVLRLVIMDMDDRLAALAVLAD